MVSILKGRETTTTRRETNLKKIVKSLIIVHTSPNNNFLFTQYIYFTLLNPNMSFIFN